MFTTKYIMSDGCEQIAGPFDMVTRSFVDRDGRQCDPSQSIVQCFPMVCASSENGPSVQFGPLIQPELAPDQPAPVERPSLFTPTVYVMNDRGATVAKYLLA